MRSLLVAEHFIERVYHVDFPVPGLLFHVFHARDNPDNKR
jgi:hypothetical protein